MYSTNYYSGSALRHLTQEDFSEATAMAPATCGELVQGVIEGREFLINSPINLFSEVSVQLTDDGFVHTESPGIYRKVEQAVTATLRLCGLKGTGARIEIHTEIPRGKGLASSTSEITAAIMATTEAAGCTLPTRSISDLAIGVEPSDGIYYPGVVMYDHLSGELLEVFGNPPLLSFCIVDTGGAIDTVSFDREKFRANAIQQESQIRRAVDLVTRGFRTSNPSLIAQGATLSSLSNQLLLPKPGLHDLLAATRETGSLGVNCAHSGTVLGVMFDPSQTVAEKIVRSIENTVGAKNIIGVYSLISGGARFNPSLSTY